MTITYALIQMVEKIAEMTNEHVAKIVTKARATNLLTNAQGAVVGVEYEKGGQKFKEMVFFFLARSEILERSGFYVGEEPICWHERIGAQQSGMQRVPIRFPIREARRVPCP